MEMEGKHMPSSSGKSNIVSTQRIKGEGNYDVD
jgi:hypothetical protein